MMETDFPTPKQMHEFGHSLHSIVSMLPKIGLLFVLVIVGALCFRLAVALASRLLSIRRLLKQKAVLLEVTPQAFADIDAMATQGLFSELHGSDGVRAYRDKALLRRVTFSPEIVSTRDGGIRYVIRVNADDREDFERAFSGYDAAIQFQQVEDYLPPPQKLRRSRIIEFHQTRGFLQPLKSHTMLNVSDPATYITSAMIKLKPGELMAVQLVLTPTELRVSDKAAGRLLYNDEQVHNLGKRRIPVVKPVLFGVSKMLFAVTGSVGDLTHGPSEYSSQTYQDDMRHYRQVSKGIKPARTLGHIEQPLAQSAYDKASDKQYRVNIRVIVLTDDGQRTISRAKSMRKAFSVFDVPKYQRLRARLDFPYSIKGRYREFMFRNRLPGLSNKRACILSVAEVAGIYHFPHSISARTEGVSRSLSEILPAPPIIKKRADNHEFDVLLGQNIHHGEVTDIGILAKEREKHMYIIGGTGNGKTTFMEYGVVQDIRNGKGVALIDPHGDSAKKILKYIPEERIKDV
ncbi:MAG TPA: hypothetical protein VLH38_00045, partial [Patescibacteria group bacterium]|nr:hypothetical protein [Patescibacteria group bacterium]